MFEPVVDGWGDGNYPSRHMLSFFGPLQGIAETLFPGRWIPFDDNEFGIDVIPVALIIQGIDEQLHSLEKIPPVIIIPGHGDNAEIGMCLRHFSNLDRMIHDKKSSHVISAFLS